MSHLILSSLSLSNSCTLSLSSKDYYNQSLIMENTHGIEDKGEQGGDLTLTSVSILVNPSLKISGKVAESIDVVLLGQL